MLLRRGLFLLSALAAFPAFAQLDQLQGLHGLTDIPLAELSQQDDNPLGKVALALHPDDWKHAEGEHFIYHYVRNFVASRLAIEAEFNFRVIAQELGNGEPAAGRKSHIYLFDQPEDWAAFQKAGELEPWTGGIHSSGSLFLLRDPSYKFSGHTLGHEIAHLMVYRRYGRGLPAWLNEGFAEYVSRNSWASYERARGYLAKPHSTSLAPGQFIPLGALMSYDRAPNNNVETYYNEAERLVRFLARTDHARFLALLGMMAAKENFETALAQSYAGVFTSRADFEAKFRDYASKDFDTTAQGQ